MQVQTTNCLETNLRSLRRHANPELLDTIAYIARGRAAPLPQGYPAGADDRAQAWAGVVERYEASPAAITFNELRPIEGSRRIADTVIADVFREAVADCTLDASIVPAHGPLVCFGAGGYAGAFLGRYENRDLFVLDPNIEAFCATLTQEDWTGICSQVERRGGRVTFVWNDNPSMTAMAAIEFIRAECQELVDGTRLAVGYRNAAVEATAAAFMERRDSLIAYNGYVEDESGLYRQAFGNLLHHEHRLLDRDLPRRAGAPAIVVGSGASLNDCFDLLRQVRERACIISCGTALMPLLDHGVRPHLHCELESVPFIRDILRFTASRHDLSGIVLGASNTVHPDVCALFDERILCFREGVAPTRVLNGEVAPLRLIAPSCTNTGVRFAHALGFSDVYLFGIDLAVADPDRHHAEGSIYQRIDAFHEFVGEDGPRLPARGAAMGSYDRVVEGNFRRTVNTNANMLMMRGSFELLAAALGGVRLYNCSDGLRIVGFEPCRPETLVDSLAEPTGSEAGEMLRRTMAALTLVEPGALVDRERVAAFEASLHEWWARALAVIEEAETASLDFPAFQERFRPLLLTAEFAADAKDVEAACRYVHTGTFLKILHFLRYAHSRLDASDRERLMVSALPHLARTVVAIRDGGYFDAPWR